jgi:hypothetical protein
MTVMMMMIMIMWMGVRLRLWTADTNRPIFHPQVIYEHGESWWNDVDRGKLPIRPPELSRNSINISHLVEGSRRNGRRE